MCYKIASLSTQPVVLTSHLLNVWQNLCTPYFFAPRLGCNIMRSSFSWVQVILVYEQGCIIVLCLANHYTFIQQLIFTVQDNVFYSVFEFWCSIFIFVTTRWSLSGRNLVQNLGIFLKWGSQELLHLLLLQVKGFTLMNMRFFTQTPVLV